MKKRKIIVSLFALLGLASCWEDVEVELDLGEPQLAVSDIGLAAGEKIRIAKELKKNGVADNIIASATGIPEQQIAALK